MSPYSFNSSFVKNFVYNKWLPNYTNIKLFKQFLQNIFVKFIQTMPFLNGDIS